MSRVSRSKKNLTRETYPTIEEIDSRLRKADELLDKITKFSQVLSVLERRGENVTERKEKTREAMSDVIKLKKKLLENQQTLLVRLARGRKKSRKARKGKKSRKARKGKKSRKARKGKKSRKARKGKKSRKTRKN